MGINFTQKYNCNKCGKSFQTNTDEGVRYSIMSIEYDRTSYRAILYWLLEGDKDLS